MGKWRFDQALLQQDLSKGHEIMKNIRILLQAVSGAGLLCLLLSATATISGANEARITVDPPTAPRLLLLEGDSLQSVRMSLQAGETIYRPPLEKLEEEASVALKVKPYSVIAKTLDPPSGDKHDYMSVAPYWWPDPTKTDGLPYINKDGQINPEVNRVTDKNYMELMSNQAQTLALAYYFTRDERYAKHAAKLLKTWFLDKRTRMNPHLDYAQAIRGITPGRGIGHLDDRGGILAAADDPVAGQAGPVLWVHCSAAGLNSANRSISVSAPTMTSSSCSWMTSS